MAEVSLVAEMSARVATTWPPTWPVCSCAMWSSDHSNTNLSSSTLFHRMCACIQPCQVLERGPYQIIQRFCFKTFRTDLYRLAFSVGLKAILRCAACSSSSHMLCTCNCSSTFNMVTTWECDFPNWFFFKKINKHFPMVVVYLPISPKEIKTCVTIVPPR